MYTGPDTEDSLIDTGEFRKLGAEDAAAQMYHALRQVWLAHKGQDEESAELIARVKKVADGIDRVRAAQQKQEKAQIRSLSALANTLKSNMEEPD